MAFARDLAPELKLNFVLCDRPDRRQEPSGGYNGCRKLKTV
jgi:hypothetical protein